MKEPNEEISLFGFFVGQRSLVYLFTYNLNISNTKIYQKNISFTSKRCNCVFTVNSKDSNNIK